MFLVRQVVDQLGVPGEADGYGVGVRGQPTVVMSAALAQPPAIGGKAEQWHDQHRGGDRVCIRARLEEAERPRLQAVAQRLLSSATDADDAVQEAWLRLSRTDASQVDNLGGWLTTGISYCSPAHRVKARQARSLTHHIQREERTHAA